MDGSGLCECGCGETTNIVQHNSPSQNLVKGEPFRFIRGHQFRLPRIGGKRIEIDPETGCHNWLLGKSRHGYGRMSIGREKVRVHRYFYEQAFGELPDDILLHHTCGNSSCVNIAHLQPVTFAEHYKIHENYINSRRPRKTA